MHRAPFESLTDVRVLDLTDRWGQFAGRLLTQLGADVVVAEPPGGHELRTAWPMVVGPDDTPVSLYFWHFAMGKSSTTWELDRRPAEAEALLRAADVVLVGRGSHRALRERMPDAVSAARVVALSPFGLDADERPGEDDLHVSAQSGVAGLSAYSSGETDPDPMPVIPPVEQSMHAAGIYGAIAVMLALRTPRSDGGSLFDVSAQAAAFQSTEQLFAHWVYRKEELYPRTGGYATSRPSGRWQISASDGMHTYAFGLLPRTQRSWDALRDWIRREGAIEDLDEPRFAALSALRGANPYDVSDAGRHAGEVITRFLGAVPADRAYREGQAAGVPWAKVFRPEEVLDEEQFRVRDLWQPTALSSDGPAFSTQALPWLRSGPSSAEAGETFVLPRPGEHTAQVAARWLSAARTGGRPAGTSSQQ
ncbi:hypothetical protein PSU4_01710 [Pseudonocardia sulfidoxydans NBRC 16205]|uniref:CoA transferase n=1 Tax=Pseudonocardia sulfidoxydans NBRC 16205 TaxID=1223511 RepID=A0A511D9E1_9PSEU|nr:CoA transferase [Pseudonocardia sulfidoxydans]GEL21217.1 hypothetical protein PSU4_01710 [Pseudonocardia sulfidoxydans NBRC 16205]